jgi:hypothetical protein
MNTVQTIHSGRNFTFSGLAISAILTLAAIVFEPRLLPLALVAGPAFIGLILPPPGRRVYRDLGIAFLLAAVAASIMMFSSPTA